MDLNMSIDSYNLEEWFLIHQLKSIRKRHFHLPFYLDVDITPYCLTLSSHWNKFPLTSFLIKALGILLEDRPQLNKMVFNSILGGKILRPNYISVNLPILLNTEGIDYVGATTIKKPHVKSIREIQNELKRELQKDPRDLPIGKFIYKRKNSFLNRSRLRLIHFLVWNVPQFYLRFGGGGITLSSLLNLKQQNFSGHIVSFGPTAFTLCTTSFQELDGKHILKVGVAFDHFALTGQEGVECFRHLNNILNGKDKVLFKRVIGKDLNNPSHHRRLDH